MAKGILVAAMDFTESREDEFNDWYDLEHVPERLRVPGFINAERWISTENPKHSLATYDLDNVDVLYSPGYNAIGRENSSPWTKRTQRFRKSLMRYEGEQILPGDKIAPAEAVAILVIGTVIVYGFMKHGLGFLKLFVPKGVPLVMMVLVVPIEVISFVSRPISLSVRLFANMLAGHITLKVFSGFVVSLSALGAVGVAGSILPLAMAVALTALELLVAFLQAYVFAVLTCMYLNDALHPSH